jgi:TolA-binding protein
MVKLKNVILLLLMMLLAITSVVAAGEITQDANKLNYWTAGSHIVTVDNTGTLQTTATIVSPWTVTATTGGCTEPVANTVSCDLAAAGSGTYTVTSDATVGEYATQALALTTNNSYTGEIVTFVRVQDEEIFKTLVEYGRGRGNYFYDSGIMRTKGVQCTDLPAETNIELNYLHKIYPIINNYLNIPSAEGTDLSIYCTYPNETVGKQHLASSVVLNGAKFQVNYTSDWLKSSWEKVFFLVQDFDEGKYSAGQSITVNCSNIKYYLAAANGWVSVDTDAFTLNFRDATPITVSATANPSTIGTGTSEVLITYTITNTETMTLSSSTNPLMIDIKAPPEAEFIGTRGELWGTGLQVYHYEVNGLDPNEVLTITLAARFATTGTTPLNLSQGVSVSFIPCWQVNAYNPLATEQTIMVGNTIAVNGSAVAVKSVVNELESIQGKLDTLTAISTQINTTVNAINNLVLVINQTTQSTDSYLKNEIETKLDQINATSNYMKSYLDNQITNYLAMINATTLRTDGTVNYINGTTSNIYSYLQTTVYNYLSTIDATTTDTNIVVHQLNTTSNSIQVTVTGIETTVNQMNTTITGMNLVVNNIDNTVTQINGTVNNIAVTSMQINETLNNVWQWSNNVNVTINNMYNLLNQINTTIDGGAANYTARFDALDTYMSGLTTDVRQLSEFSEESIYLITDSITEGQQAYKDALTALDSGDSEKAIQKLQESINLLSTAETKIGELQAVKSGDSSTVTKTTTLTTKDAGFIERIILWLSRIFG